MKNKERRTNTNSLHPSSFILHPSGGGQAFRLHPSSATCRLFPLRLYFELSRISFDGGGIRRRSLSIAGFLFFLGMTRG
jgi:hypothetical protein